MRSTALEAISSGAGERLDVWLARRADTVAAISPLLAQRLSRASVPEVRYLPMPWPVPPAITADERALARTELGIATGEEVVLYVGNLDAYQGLASLFGAMERLRAKRPRARLLAMTASAGELPPGTLRLSPSDERARRRVYAAASVVAVPRRLAAGVPVKLLDALSRGARVVTTSAGLGGLAGVPVAIADDAAASFAARLEEQLDARDDVAERGRAYVREAHSMARCAELLAALAAR
jgi:glycosyltransferase involved in cell wall biosynthesis